jgi:hypothetical protein
MYRFGGDEYAALHVAPILGSLGFIVAMIALTNQLYGRTLALLCGVCLACGPAALMEYSVWPGYNYLQAMALGTGALALTLSAVRGRHWSLLPVAAFLLGLALWAQPLALAYVPAVAVLLPGPLRRAWPGARWRLLLSGLCSVAAFVLALWPALVYNWQSRWSTLRFLATRPNHAHIGVLEALHRMLTWAGPTLLGLIPPQEDPTVFVRYLGTHTLLYGLSLVLVGVILGRIAIALPTVRRWFASLGTATPTGEAALLVLAATLVVGYLFSNWSSSRWSATDPRYLLPLYTLLPLALRAVFPPASPRYRRAAGAALLVLILVVGLAANGVAAPPLGESDTLAHQLETRGDQVIYGDYWLVYRLAFASHENLIPVVTDPRSGLGYNRYVPYLAIAAHRQHIAWLVPPGGAERALRHCLAAHHAPYSRALGRDGTKTVVIYDHLSQSSAACPIRG